MRSRSPIDITCNSVQLYCPSPPNSHGVASCSSWPSTYLKMKKNHTLADRRTTTAITFEPASISSTERIHCWNCSQLSLASRSALTEVKNSTRRSPYNNDDWRKDDDLWRPLLETAVALPDKHCNHSTSLSRNKAESCKLYFKSRSVTTKHWYRPCLSLWDNERGCARCCPASSGEHRQEGRFHHPPRPSPDQLQRGLTSHNT